MKKPIRIVRKDKVARAKRKIAAGAYDPPTKAMVNKAVKGILRDL